MLNYSIIIPHKNIPHLLIRCLDSIPKRADVQIIVVDDNSDILESQGINLLHLSEKYPNVEFVFGKNENGRRGAGYARNLGLERAKGKWVVFADADDFFSKEFNQVLNLYIDNESDLICFKYQCVDSDTLKQLPESYYMNMLKIADETHNKKLIYNIPAMYSKFVKRDLITKYNILFQEVLFSNDNWFNLQVVFRTNTFYVANEVIYCYAIRTNSLTTKKRDFNNILIRINVLTQAILFLRKVSPENLYFWLNEYYKDIVAWKPKHQRLRLILESCNQYGYLILWLLSIHYLVPNIKHKIFHNAFTKFIKSSLKAKVDS